MHRVFSRHGQSVSIGVQVWLILAFIQLFTSDDIVSEVDDGEEKAD
jgi:hypothetical protein